MKYLVLLGRQPELSMAELESVYGAEAIKVVDEQFASIEIKPDLNQLGGSIKAAEIDEELSGDWQTALQASQSLIEKVAARRQAKISVGFSVYGQKVPPRKLQEQSLKLKKKLKEKSISIRVVPTKNSRLNSAQVIHNKLVSDKGVEVIILVKNDKCLIAHTIEEQDIEAYTLRDRSKPVRDPIVGMLPPKLALIMINLAKTTDGERILDPFCGTGTVLIEAINLGRQAYGSDISERMIEASRQNLDWFNSTFNHSDESILQVADATVHHWEQPIDAVVSETFLGPPMKKLPNKSDLSAIMSNIDKLHRDFLGNLAPQLKSGSRVVLAVPAWKDQKGFNTLKMVDDLENLGYTRSSFIQASNELVYHRPDQIVGRQILVLLRS